MIRLLALIAGLSASSALKVPSRDAVDANAVDAIFKIKSPEVADYSYEPVALTPAALLDPFVDASRKLTRFKTPYVKVTKTDGEETYRYDREPSTAEDAQALLELEELSYVLKYELLEELSEWPEALAALLPPRLVDTLTEDPYVGGTTVHAYLSAPGAVALPSHEDLGDVLVLQLLGEKTWSIDGRDDVTVKPGDALWIPQGVSHSAVAQSTLSGHLTIHRITPEHVAKHEAQEEKRRQLHHITGDDGTLDDEIVFRPDSCSVWDAGCTGGRFGRCTCNLCHACSDAGAFCAFEASDVTMYDPCCKPGDDDGCDPAYHDDDGPAPYPHDAPHDADGWVVLSKPDKGCDWVAEKPSKRCSEKGVLIHRESHYGLEWLLENQPRWTAKEACPLTCGTLCGDDLDWKYTVEPMSCSGRNICGCDDKSFCDFKDRSKRFWDRPSISPGGSCEKCPKDIEKCEKSFRPEAGVVDCKNCCFDADEPTLDDGTRGCLHVAQKPEKRCSRIGEDGRSAREACPLTCGACDAPIRTDKPTPKPTKSPTKKPVSFDDWVATDKDIGKAVKLWCKDPEDALARYGKPIGEWDVSRVTKMNSLFSAYWCDKRELTDDLSAWNTKRVTNMRAMFEGRTGWEGFDMSGWKTSKVTDMSWMFLGCKNAALTGLSDWDVSKVTSMRYMFRDVARLGQGQLRNSVISGWDVSNVKDFEDMFRCSCDDCDSCSKFNQDLSGWSVNQATDMSNMFRGANSFDQDLGWTVDESNGFLDYGSSNGARSNEVFTGTKCEADECGVTFELDPIAEAGHKLCTESGFDKHECRAQTCCRWTAGKTCVLIDYAWADECRTGTRLDVTAADARGAGAFSTLLLVGSMLAIAAFIVGRKATRAAESEPLLATTA